MYDYILKEVPEDLKSSILQRVLYGEGTANKNSAEQKRIIRMVTLLN